MRGISVVVCCFNSANRIGDTLSYVVAQDVHGLFAWEVIVVNNASRDNTKDVVGKFIDEYSASNFRLIDEPRPGLINARRCGIENAKYELIVFCDDDNHLDPNYLENAFQLMTIHPEVAIAGGWCRPKLTKHPGLWIEDFYGALAIENHPRTEGVVKWVYGAGMVVRKRIFQELTDRKIEFSLVGRKGSKQTSGDDAEICALVRFLGYSIYYSPGLILDHRIDENRLNKRNFLKLNTENFLPTLQLFILDKLIENRSIKIEKVLYELTIQRITRLGSAFPRLVLGKKFLYNLIEVYGNLSLLIWLPFKLELIVRKFHATRNNLYKGNYV